MRKIKVLLISIPLILTSYGCSDFLDEKSDLKLATPDRLEDNQMLLNNYGFLNVDFASSGETSSDDYYLTDADYNGLSFEATKRLHIWMPDNVASPISSGNDWSTCYRSIYICNAVLFNMQDKNFTGEQADNIRGQALALRAFRYLDAAQIWCPAYNPQTAGIHLGLPLRLDPDMNIPSVRSTVKQTRLSVTCKPQYHCSCRNRFPVCGYREPQLMVCYLVPIFLWEIMIMRLKIQNKH